MILRSRTTVILLVMATLLGLWIAGRWVEWGPFRGALWTDARGEAVSARRVSSEHAPYERRGSAHCDLGTATFIAYEKGQYTDMRGIGEENSLITFDDDAVLPTRARYTGWHRGGRQLWVDPSDLDHLGRYKNIFIVAGGEVERWPNWPLGCA